MIDIGRSVSSGNGNRVHYSSKDVPEPTPLYGEQDNSPPPSYSDKFAEFCSRCNVLPQDFTTEFCLSCGQSFSKY